MLMVHEKSKARSFSKQQNTYAVKHVFCEKDINTLQIVEQAGPYWWTGLFEFKFKLMGK